MMDLWYYVHMKYRDYKDFGEGEYFHVFNRGNQKMKIFLDNQDYNFFITRLKQYLGLEEYKNYRQTNVLPKKSFSVISYCLMPNHFHFLIRQNKDVPTSKLILKLCTSYSMYFNKKYKRVGHVFQGRFKQKLIDDDEYLLWLSAYIHQNPKLDSIVSDSKKYNWSSYLEYLNGRENSIIDTSILLDILGSIKEYEDFVEGSYKTLKENKASRAILD